MYESNISFGQVSTTNTSADLAEPVAPHLSLNEINETPTSPSSSSFNNFSWRNHSYYQQQTSSPYNYYASVYHNYYANMVDSSTTSNYYSTNDSVYSSETSSYVNSSLDSYYTPTALTSSSASASSNQVDYSTAPISTTNYYDSSLSSSAYNSYDSYSQISSPAPTISSQSSSSVRKEQEKVVDRIESSKPTYDYSAKLSRKHQLPDRAVEIMNEWFDEHEHNPYPQQCEKEAMAQRGGISIKQVTAWFSNRRNRSQNTKPKRMQRVIKDNFSKICQEIAYNPDPNVVAEKVRLFQETLEKRY